MIKRELKPTMQAINAALIDTIAACGDVNRNVMVVAESARSRSAHASVYECAARLSEHLLPRTRAYYEIWLDEERVAGSGEEDEPIYGPTYLPRKFKIAFAVPPINDVDVFANDLGFIAIVEDGALVGFNVAVGGGLGATHGDAATYPRLADVIGFIARRSSFPGCRSRGDRRSAISATVRSASTRGSSTRSTIAGSTGSSPKSNAALGSPLAPARPFVFEHNGDRFGWTRGRRRALAPDLAHRIRPRRRSRRKRRS